MLVGLVSFTAALALASLILVIMPLSEGQFSGLAQHQLSALSVSRPASARLLANLI
jgi:hypothetical protein